MHLNFFWSVALMVITTVGSVSAQGMFHAPITFTASKEVTIGVSGAPPCSSLAVKLVDPGRPDAAMTVMVEVDNDGNGSFTWTPPASWEQVDVIAEDFLQLSRFITSSDSSQSARLGPTQHLPARRRS